MMEPLRPQIEALNLQPAGRQRVALVLAELHDADEAQFRATMEQIGSAAGLSRAQARKHVRALIDAGLLRVVAHAHGGAPGLAPRYEFALDAIGRRLASAPGLFHEVRARAAQ